MPDHALFETHPVVNSLLPYYVGQGDIAPKPDIARIDGRTVQFVDGTSAMVDLIVFATEYHLDFPFIDRRHLNWADGRPRPHQNVFHPAYDTRFVSGLLQPDSGQFGLVHWQTRAAALFLAAAGAGDPAADWLRAEKADALAGSSGGVRYKDSARHFIGWSIGAIAGAWSGSSAGSRVTGGRERSCRGCELSRPRRDPAAAVRRRVRSGAATVAPTRPADGTTRGIPRSRRTAG